MHDGCSGNFTDGREVVNKVRAMGFSTGFLPVPMKLKCKECGADFEMNHFEDNCSSCGMVYGVTPCHASDPDAVQAAGIGY